MLKRVGEFSDVTGDGMCEGEGAYTVNSSGAVTTVGEASFPAPFASVLEFNSPVHGNWNIVHSGMRLPESRQIYVCADNCMRGVVLTAAEMNEAERFSFVIVEEEHLLTGNLEEITIEGVTDVLHKLPKLPRAVLLFTVCVHHFLGCDLDRVYEELEERFPQVVFLRCYMDPILQKTELTPDQKLRKAMYDALPGRSESEQKVTSDALLERNGSENAAKQRKGAKSVSLLGSDFALDETADIPRFLKRYGYTLKELPKCGTWEEYLDMGNADLFISCYPPGRYGAAKQAERLGKEHLYLPACFGYEEIERHMRELSQALGLPELTAAEIECERRACDEALKRTLEEVGDTPVAIDYLFHPRPLGLARLLITHGFSVETVYLDSISLEEKEDFAWLKEHRSNLRLIATIQPKMRTLPRGDGRKILAIGPKAAWFTKSRHFVNMVQGGGLYGFDGIRKVAELMTEAFREEKDTENLVIRKGWGCDCCL